MSAEKLAELAAGLPAWKRKRLLAASPADSFEYWLHDDIEDRRLAGSDLVLTPLGVELRQHLLATRPSGGGV